MHTEKGTEVWNDLHNSELTLEIKEEQAISTTGDEGGRFEEAKVVDDKIQENKNGEKLIGTIHWDHNSPGYVYNDEPTKSVNSAITGQHAPSTILLHEAGHAQRYDKALQNKDGETRAGYNIDYGLTDWNYDNEEERRNTQEVEEVYLNQINEYEEKQAEKNNTEPVIQPIRRNHKGLRLFDRFYNVDDPNKSTQADVYKEEYQRTLIRRAKVEEQQKRENKNDH